MKLDQLTEVERRQGEHAFNRWEEARHAVSSAWFAVRRSREATDEKPLRALEAAIGRAREALDEIDEARKVIERWRAG